ncbi:2124_t:CDS:2, partial [Racocetra persica]
KLAVVITNISDLDENRFYEIESECIRTITEKTPDKIWKK